MKPLKQSKVKVNDGGSGFVARAGAHRNPAISGGIVASD